MPVVSQSMSSPMVPVGASTVAWLLRTPCCSARSQASSQASWAASIRSGGTSSSSMEAVAVRCCSSTRSMCSRLAWNPANGPMRSASRVEVR